MINGYFIEPGRQLFFRGKLNDLYSIAIGEGVIHGSKISLKYKLENNLVTTLKEIPSFNRITISDLFNVQFDTEIK